MLTEEEAARLMGATLTAADGAEVGTVDEVLTHAADNRAAWAAATVDDRHVLVPLDGAKAGEGELHVRYTAEQIASAPEVDDVELTDDAAHRLYDHYGIDDSTLRDDSGFATEVGHRGEPNAVGDPREGGPDDAQVGHP
ncbi:MAG TPA: PRC-barrel domain-containing protein [Solirubrobacteraceae bacterium]|nr:PRC-barrel domain-containing protein [Solirubrobacteraceae bacterium]